MFRQILQKRSLRCLAAIVPQSTALYSIAVLLSAFPYVSELLVLVVTCFGYCELFK